MKKHNMSRWIHVAGCIRFDTVVFEEEAEFLAGSKKERALIKKALGRIPKGSEGSLDIQIVDVQPPVYEEHGMYGSSARWAVLITGDLRDVDNFDCVERWVKRINTVVQDENSRVWVRQGVIQAMSNNNYPEIISKVFEIKSS